MPAQPFIVGLPNGIAARRRRKSSSAEQEPALAGNRHEAEGGLPSRGRAAGRVGAEAEAGTEIALPGKQEAASVNVSDSSVRFSRRTDKNTENVERKRGSAMQGDGVRTDEGVPQGTAQGPTRTSGSVSEGKDASPAGESPGDRARRKFGVGLAPSATVTVQETG